MNRVWYDINSLINLAFVLSKYPGKLATKPVCWKSASCKIFSGKATKNTSVHYTFDDSVDNFAADGTAVTVFFSVRSSDIVDCDLTADTVGFCVTEHDLTVRPLLPDSWRRLLDKPELNDAPEQGI